ncbi:hypothetical protein ACE3MZ_22930 [Paenibacillus sp. WLX1005]|uniref:hypothetical protein n=1 Tax=Paenibacillus sp. WLX1005 TaxID=3243766 RepID=UPI00398414FC
MTLLQQPVIAAVIILAIIAAGEVISVLTRAKVPMLLIAILIYMGLLWTGILPKDIIKNSTFTSIGMVMIAPLIVHMGTLIPFKVMKQQYKSVLISLISVLIGGGLVLLIIPPILGYTTAVIGIGPMIGGNIATIITTTELERLGLNALVTIPVLMLAIHKLFGMPLTSYFLQRYAIHFRDHLQQQDTANDSDLSAIKGSDASAPSGRFNSPYIMVFKLFLGGALATMLDEWTGINYTLFCLIFGIVGAQIGFYQQNMMDHAKATGIAMIGTVFIVISSMTDVTFGMFISYIPKVLLILLFGLVGVLVGGYFSSKLLKWDPRKGMSVALTSMYGFPADYILCQEVSRSVGRTPEEQKRILDDLAPPMLIGGFTTVTVASVVIASLLIKTL